MIICVDVGNTRTKVAVYENSTLQQLIITNNEKLIKNISKQIQGIQNCVDIILSSVGNLSAETIEKLKTLGNLITVTHESLIPFKNLFLLTLIFSITSPVYFDASSKFLYILKNLVSLVKSNIFFTLNGKFINFKSPPTFFNSFKTATNTPNPELSI